MVNIFILKIVEKGNNMKGIILLANGFEDVEALTPIDLLRRGNIQIDLISMNDNLTVVSKANITYQADYIIKGIDYSTYDFLIIPGGPAVWTYHLTSEITKEIVDHFEKNQKLIACICAAPSILGKYGYLDYQEFVCYPSFEQYANAGIYRENQKVVVSGNHITSKAAGTSFEFSYEIIKYLKGDSAAKTILNSVYY